MQQPLASTEVLVVTGKGGTGKSTLAAGLGRALSESGRRILLLEADPRESVHRLFERPPSGGDVVRLGPRLWLQNLRPRAVLDELVRERVPVGLLARRVLASPIYEHFVDGAPGLSELAVLGHCLKAVRGEAAGSPAVDLVVLDAPASGHGLALLEAPLLVEQVVRKGPIGAMTRAVARLVREPGRLRTVVVTQAEEMPVTEALELADGMRRRLERLPDLLLVNGLFPEIEPPKEAGTAEDGHDRLGRLWRRRRALNEAELARLASRWEGPAIELPLLPVDPGPELVEALLPQLDDALRAIEGAR